MSLISLNEESDRAARVASLLHGCIHAVTPLSGKSVRREAAVSSNSHSRLRNVTPSPRIWFVFRPASSGDPASLDLARNVVGVSLTHPIYCAKRCSGCGNWGARRKISPLHTHQWVIHRRGYFKPPATPGSSNLPPRPHDLYERAQHLSRWMFSKLPDNWLAAHDEKFGRGAFTPYDAFGSSIREIERDLGIEDLTAPIVRQVGYSKYTVYAVQAYITV